MGLKSSGKNATKAIAKSFGCKVRAPKINILDSLQKEHDEGTALVENHISEEERSICRDVKKSLPEEDRLHMNRAFSAAKNRVKIL